ncbi:hypothetical protein BDY19DRAFT_904884 [Irpex rosettiformis]|uniref:Uncharacterized protein n=1 Tax=Irpex rosettiformis TaxID=378272 RepID=A0ACB8U9E3_9APHY|nr:hypothetical protein BDY19DRAFT_904884 [Irpex rosettiformis]
MSSTDPINYAHAEGIFKSELAGAIIFAVAYVPLFLYNVFRSIRRPTYVLFMLSLFCIIRITAFILRAIIATSAPAGENLGLVIAAGVIYSVGFFGLLYSAYTLVLDREQILGYEDTNVGPLAIIRRVMRMRHLIRLVLTAAVVLGIVGGVKASDSDPSEQSTGNSLRHGSVYIFLVIAILLVFLTVDLAWEEHKAGTRSAVGELGNRYALFLLTIIALMCLIREVFFVATTSNTKQQNNADLYYPLAALPELIAVCLFSVPGLVPSRKEIAKREMDDPEWAELTRRRNNSSSLR